MQCIFRKEKEIFMLKLRQIAYTLLAWDQVCNIVIMKVKITGIKLVDENNIMYLCENSRFKEWVFDTKVYTSIDEALENLRERVVE